MSDIDELQQRITAALDRIGQGLDVMSAGGGEDAAEMESLRQQLEDEKLASQQLKERLKTIRKRHNSQKEISDAAQAEQAEAARKLDTELQSLRKSNSQLRENNQALREAMEADVTEPHLINKAMLTELEALRASRATDRAEANAVLADLSQLISTAPGGGGGGNRSGDEISQAGEV